MVLFPSGNRKLVEHNEMNIWKLYVFCIEPSLLKSRSSCRGLSSAPPAVTALVLKKRICGFCTPLFPNSSVPLLVGEVLFSPLLWQRQNWFSENSESHSTECVGWDSTARSSLVQCPGLSGTRKSPGPAAKHLCVGVKSEFWENRPYCVTSIENQTLLLHDPAPSF